MKPAPNELSEHGKKFWEAVQVEYDLADHHHFEVLYQCSLCLDLVENARQALIKDGDYLKDRYGGVKPHPALKSIKDAQGLFYRLLRELSLDAEPPPHPGYKR